MVRRKYKEIYYWQEDRTQKEVDFVIKEKGMIIALNLCYSDDIHERESEGLVAFSKVVNADRYIIISRDVFKKETHDNITIEIIPLWVSVFLNFI